MAGGREQIIECAFRLFLKNGYENTSMMDLVRASGLSKGAFYHYYQSKETLFRASVDHFFLSFFSNDGAEQSSSDLLSFVESLWKSYARLLVSLKPFVDEYSSYYRFLFSVFEKFPQIKSQLSHKIEDTEKRLISGFSKLQSDGRISTDLNPLLLSKQLMSMIEGRGLLLSIRSEDDINDSFQQMINSFWKTILIE